MAQLNARVGDELYADFCVAAKLDGRSATSAIELQMQEYVKQVRDKNKKEFAKSRSEFVRRDTRKK